MRTIPRSTPSSSDRACRSRRTGSADESAEPSAQVGPASPLAAPQSGGPELAVFAELPLAAPAVVLRTGQRRVLSLRGTARRCPVIGERLVAEPGDCRFDAGVEAPRVLAL